MKAERLWFYLGFAWTIVSILAILFSWYSSIELSVYWFGCILMGQICFLHAKMLKIQPE